MDTHARHDGKVAIFGCNIGMKEGPAIFPFVGQAIVVVFVPCDLNS